MVHAKSHMPPLGGSKGDRTQNARFLNWQSTAIVRRSPNLSQFGTPLLPGFNLCLEGPKLFCLIVVLHFE